jgi:hypothetical protein
VAALHQLASTAVVPPALVAEAIARYELSVDTTAPWSR